MARVLIIDDDPSVSLTLSRMLEFDGHVVIHVESGQAGLDVLARQPPDAIILDIRMPGMSGLDFLRTIRASDRHSALPVGVLTGDYFLKEPVLEELARLGAIIRYKPLWLEDLAALTRALLEPGSAH